MGFGTGVTQAKRKNGTVYYRASITLQSRHISLGSFSRPEQAAQAYQEAVAILREGRYTLSDYTDVMALPFERFVSLVNYHNSGIYFKTPIYLESGYFCYYLTPEQHLIFDRDDLFFYATHKIQTRGGYYFICDYGSQYSILSRYGIKGYAKKGQDYLFVNQNDRDFRYENIRVINGYRGVSRVTDENHILYECIIHIRGNFLVGRYPDEDTAAVAYNKAVDTLTQRGLKKRYIKNFISSYSSAQYQAAYDSVRISDKICHYTPQEGT